MIIGTSLSDILFVVQKIKASLGKTKFFEVYYIKRVLTLFQGENNMKSIKIYHHDSLLDLMVEQGQ